MNPTRPALGLLAALTATMSLAAVPSAAPALLAEPDPLAWWNQHGTAMAAMGLLHVVALAAGAHVTLVLALVTTAAALRRPWTARWVARLGPRAVRRWLATGLVAGTLASSAAGAQPPGDGPSRAAPIAAEATITLVDLGPAPSATAPPATSLPSSPAPAEPAEPPAPIRDGFRPPRAGTTPDAWLVEPGDHLWSIAAATVAAAAAQEPTTAQVHAYWRALIAANATNVADPDLIHPGQVLDLPPVIRAGS